MTLPIVVGLGSHCGDDQAGWLIVEQLRSLGYPGDRLKQVSHSAAIMDVIEPQCPLIVCDACHQPDLAGQIYSWEWPNRSIVDLSRHGTHDMGLNEILILAGELGQQPASIDIWAVSGNHWQPASPASGAVIQAARQAANQIWSQYAHA